jgi:signal transduction histidine kinase
VLAAIAGWFVSRQISKPLLGLTDVTVRMTNGELSARADVRRQDELGILAASFNTMADRIEEIVVTLQRFVADAAHELHTPLTALRTNLELLDFDQNPEAVKRAHEQVIRLEKLTDGLLSLSRIEAQTGATQTSALDLVTLIRSISEVYASRAEQADLDYDLHLPDAMPTVTANAEQIGCVISNLLDNAIKFTPPGGTVRLNLQQADHQVKLIVQDTGIGIPPDDLPALFERFRRGRNACGYPGSGLGLAIVRAIVKAHGGSVHAENGNPGTIITVTLPLTGTAPDLA